MAQHEWWDTPRWTRGQSRPQGRERYERSDFSRSYHGRAAIGRIVNTTLGDTMHQGVALALSVAVIA